MKKIYLSLGIAMLAGTAPQLQAQCSTGRYATDVYTNVTVTNDITYGVNKTLSGTTQTLTLDFYQPTADTSVRRPLIIWAHGGSFIGGTKNDQDVSDLSMRLAKKGFVCASINYRLGFSPFDSTGVVPAVVRAVQDMKAAIRFFYKDRSTANTYKIDTNNIFIGGSSAGAITALHTAYLDRTCEINTYINPTALSALGGIEGGSGNQCYSTRVKGVINLCGALAKFYWFESGNVPLCSMHGTADPVVPYGRGKANPGIPIMYLDGSRWLYAQSQAATITNPFYTWNGAGHVPYAGSSAAAIAYMDTTVKFVRDYLVTRIGCTETPLMPPNTPSTTVSLPSYTACTGNVSMPCDVGVQEINAELVQQIYPNPSNGDVTISFVNSGTTHTMTLTDVSGKLISSEMSTQDTYIFQKRDLAPGIYFMKVANTKGQSSVKKIIFF